MKKREEARALLFETLLQHANERMHTSNIFVFFSSGIQNNAACCACKRIANGHEIGTHMKTLMVCSLFNVWCALAGMHSQIFHCVLSSPLWLKCHLERKLYGWEIRSHYAAEINVSGQISEWKSNSKKRKKKKKTIRLSSHCPRNKQQSNSEQKNIHKTSLNVWWAPPTTPSNRHLSMRIILRVCACTENLR